LVFKAKLTYITVLCILSFCYLCQAGDYFKSEFAYWLVKGRKFATENVLDY